MRDTIFHSYTMTKRVIEKPNNVIADETWRQRIKTETMSQCGMGRQMFPQVETEQGEWKVGMKMFPGIDGYVYPTNVK